MPSHWDYVLRGGRKKVWLRSSETPATLLVLTVATPAPAYPRNEIKIPAATAEPMTPDTLDDMQ